MRASDRKFVIPNGEKIIESIKKSGISQDKLSTMVLGKNSAYISQSISRGSFDAENLKRLCEFLGVEYETCIVSDVPKKAETVELSTGENADVVPYIQTMVAGLNTMYNMQKEYIESMKSAIKELTEEIKSLNAKQNRLENALGQIVQSSLITKENTGKAVDTMSAVRSQMNMANSKLKELVDGSKRYDKTYKMVQSQTGKISG